MTITDYIFLALAILGTVATLMALLIQGSGYLAARYRTRVLTFTALVFCVMKACAFGIPEAERADVEGLANNAMLAGIFVSFCWPVFKAVLRPGPGHQTTASLRHRPAP